MINGVLLCRSDKFIEGGRKNKKMNRKKKKTLEIQRNHLWIRAAIKLETAGTSETNCKTFHPYSCAPLASFPWTFATSLSAAGH